MKRIKYFVISILSCLEFLMPLTACGNPVEDATTTVEGMASQEDKAQDALDAFHQDADEKDAEYQEILDMDEE